MITELLTIFKRCCLHHDSGNMYILIFQKTFNGFKLNLGFLDIVKNISHMFLWPSYKIVYSAAAVNQRVLVNNVRCF